MFTILKFSVRHKCLKLLLLCYSVMPALNCVVDNTCGHFAKNTQIGKGTLGKDIPNGEK